MNETQLINNYMSMFRLQLCIQCEYYKIYKFKNSKCNQKCSIFSIKKYNNKKCMCEICIKINLEINTYTEKT